MEGTEFSKSNRKIHTQLWTRKYNKWLSTPPKFNMEPENDDFQAGISFFEGLIFRWTMLNFRGVYSFKPSSGLFPKIVVPSPPKSSHFKKIGVFHYLKTHQFWGETPPLFLGSKSPSGKWDDSYGLACFAAAKVEPSNLAGCSTTRTVRTVVFGKVKPIICDNGF